MSKSVLQFVICAVLVLFAGPASAVDVQMEKLGPLPYAVLSSEMDSTLWTSQSLKNARENGFSVDITACITDSCGRHVGAVVPKENGKCCVWLDGKEGPEYDQIRGLVRGAYKAREFRFSPDGNRLAYTAKKGSKWVMVVDGVEGPEFDGIREPYFSVDSKHVCYVGFRGKDCILVMDGKEVAKYNLIQMAFPYYIALTPLRVVEDTYCPVAFGAKGRFAFVASKGRSKNGAEREVAVIDGKETSEYERIGGIEFSPDGKRIAFVAKKNERWFVVLDSKPGAKYDNIAGSLAFSPDSKHFAYAATNYNANGDATSFVVVDGKPGPKFKDIIADIIFSPDSSKVTYIASPDGDKFCVVVDGKTSDLYDEIGDGVTRVFQVFGADGRLYYRAKRGDKYYMVINGKPSPAYDEIPDALPALSRDGKHYAFVARKGERWFVVQDGVEGPAYDRVYADSLVIAGDNKLAYIASKSNPFGEVAVVDGKEIPGVYRIALSADGTRVACLKNIGDPMGNTMNRISVVVDGHEIDCFENVLNLNFDQANTLTFLAVRDDTSINKLARNLYRVRVSN